MAASPRIQRQTFVRPTAPVTKGEYGRELRSMFANWREMWRDVLQGKSFVQDLLAGVTVAAVALPLNLALAVASGLPPIAGLVAGAIGGGVAAVFGGAPIQVSGPAAALQVMVLAIATDFGPVGVAAATILVGVIQLVLGGSTAGRFGKLVPESVLAGFTTGVGLKLLEGQLPELLGFDYSVGEIVGMMHKPLWLHHVSWLSVVCGLSVALLVTSTSRFKRFPAALVGVSIVTGLAVYLHWDIERVGTVPDHFPPASLPLVKDEQWFDLGSKVLPLALLAGVESLLSASVVERMAKDVRKHDPNVELLGQGLANIVTGVFGGMPVTGVVVRSSVAAQSGAKTKVAAIVHAAVLGCAVLFLSTQIAQVPLAGLAGLLCVIAIRLIEVSTLIHLVKENKVEALAFVVTAAGTVTGHLMLGLVSGLALHAGNQLFHRRERAEKAQIAKQRERGIRATLADKESKSARAPVHHAPAPSAHTWLGNVRQKALAARSAFVHAKASVIGRVVLGENVHIAAGSSVRADEGSPFFIGDDSNVQDGVVIHALKDKKVLVGGEEWAVYVGRNVSMAHDALVHGPCYVGDDTFIGFKAVVHDSVVGSHCFIGIGAVVVGVEIPDGKFVPHGRIVDTPQAVAALPDVSEAQREFNEDVVDVNRGLAAAYNHSRAPARKLVPPELDVPGFPPFRRERGYDDRF